MDKQIILFADGSMVDKVQNTSRMAAEAIRRIRVAADLPMDWLRRYYSAVLERRVSMRQTRLMTVAQLAFFAAVMPVDMPLLLRFAACAWFVAALLKCREGLRFEG